MKYPRSNPKFHILDKLNCFHMVIRYNVHTVIVLMFWRQVTVVTISIQIFYHNPPDTTSYEEVMAEKKLIRSVKLILLSPKPSSSYGDLLLCRQQTHNLGYHFSQYSTQIQTCIYKVNTYFDKIFTIINNILPWHFFFWK